MNPNRPETGPRAGGRPPATGEIRDFALAVVTSPDLDTKLTPPPDGGAGLRDESPGPALRLAGPGRAPRHSLATRPYRAPSVLGLADPGQRPRVLHALANHELQAAELFAWALLAFPEAPGEFRRGLLRILQDEQRHTRMYLARLEACGGRLGDRPLSGYFWSKTPTITTPLHFIAAMSLTFENANLDHTVDAAEAARRGGDEKTAVVVERVHRDEIEHVRFGWTWLAEWKGKEAAWEAYRRSLAWPLQPDKARGRRFHRQGREAAGLSDDFIRHLEESRP